MRLNSLELNNFRNYEREVFEFTEGINVIAGRNAQGKTNCAEAVFYLCTGYSPRSNSDKQVVRFNCNNGGIRGRATTRYGEVGIKIDFSVGDKKRVYINEVEVLRIGELMGNVNSVFFNPDELKLVKESPEDRRRFLDISLSQMDRKYFYALQRYKKILSQRNGLLKDECRELIYETLPIWDEQLAQVGAVIVKARNTFIERLKPFAEEMHSYLTSGEERLEVIKPDVYSGDIDEIKFSLKRDYAATIEKDVTLGYTTTGPHRDDLKLKINGKEARAFGSQGQQRTVALSLKLAETEIFKSTFNEYPILILDDAFSELDFSRRKLLMKRLDGIQTIITLTETDASIKERGDYKLFNVDKGKII